jgi:MFS family permease
MVQLIITLLASAVAMALVWHFTSSWGWHWLFKIVAIVATFMGMPYLLTLLHVGITKDQINGFFTFVS